MEIGGEPTKKKSSPTPFPNLCPFKWASPPPVDQIRGILWHHAPLWDIPIIPPQTKPAKDPEAQGFEWFAGLRMITPGCPNQPKCKAQNEISWLKLDSWDSLTKGIVTLGQAGWISNPQPKPPIYRWPKDSWNKNHWPCVCFFFRILVFRFKPPNCQKLIGPIIS